MEKRINENKSKDLLAALQGGRLTQSEFQRKCLEWLFEPECWDDLQPKRFPYKSDIVSKHESIAENERRKLVSTYYEDNPEILKFYSRRLRDYAFNNHKVEDLQNFLQYAENQDEVEKIKSKIKEFKAVIAEQGITLNIKKYLYSTPQVQQVVREFGGGNEHR